MNEVINRLSSRNLSKNRLSIAGAAAATAVLSLSVPTNMMLVASVETYASAGGGPSVATATTTAPIAVTAATSGSTFTAGAALPFITGTAVVVGGTAVPTGTTAGTVYYANVNALVVTLYDTQAHAVATGTGQITISSTGTAVTLTPFLLNAASSGIVTGTPVNVTGTTVPTGITAGTVYYASVTGAYISLYDTEAHAVSAAATGLVAFTTAGAAVVVQPATLNAYYKTTVAAKNINGVVTLIGTPSQTALEDVSAWDFTQVANNTTKRLDLKGTPDGTLATTFLVEAEWYVKGYRD